MNKEKELLLALLIEKYTTKPIVIDRPVRQKKRTRRPNIRTHHWTTQQKEMVWDLRRQGMSFEKIATILGNNLSAKQVSSMYANLIQRYKAVQ